MELLEERGAQGGLDPLVRAQAHEARVDDSDAGGAQPLVRFEGLFEDLANAIQRAGDGLGQGHLTNGRGQGRVGDSGDGFVDLPQPLRIIARVSGVQVEVVVRGGGLGHLDAVGDGDLGADVLLVGGGDLHEEAVGAVGGGYFRERAASRAQPEGLADAGADGSPGTDLDDVVAGAALVADEEGVVVEGSHDDSLLGWSPTCLCHTDDNPHQHLMSTRHK